MTLASHSSSVENTRTNCWGTCTPSDTAHLPTPVICPGHSGCHLSLCVTAPGYENFTLGPITSPT